MVDDAGVMVRDGDGEALGREVILLVSLMFAQSRSTYQIPVQAFFSISHSPLSRSSST